MTVREKIRKKQADEAKAEARSRERESTALLRREKGAPPLYLQLETILKSEIEHGKYNKGDLFPSERMLIEQYDVSRVTVRQALGALAQAGYLQGSRGIGTEVVYEKIDEHMKSVISFTEEMQRHNIRMETTYCQMERINPDVKVAVTLQVPRTDFCYRLTRVRSVEQKPLVYTITFLKEKVPLPLEKEYYMESLYRYLKETHGIWLEKGQDTLEAVLPTKQVQERLQIGPDMPVFKRVRKIFLAGGEIFEYSICYYPGNRYKYTVDL